MRKEEYEQFWKKFPVGYRFVPEEYELIVDYLQKKEENRALPPNKISEVNVYRFNPEELAEKFKEYGEDGRYYFFTPRDKKYRNGDRPNRAAGDGYWKATGSKSPVYLKHDAALVGYKSTLVFYRGKPPKGAKTDWIMHEFRSRNPPPPRTPTPDGMRVCILLFYYILYDQYNIIC